ARGVHCVACPPVNHRSICGVLLRMRTLDSLERPLAHAYLEEPVAREGESSVKAETAPAPDDPRKPQNPTELKKPSIKHTVKAAIGEFNRDQVTDLAAALTYYAVLSIFPALLALTSLLGVFG